MDTIIERRMPCSSVSCPRELYRSLIKFCRARNFEFESMELQNDTYVIRLRIPNTNQSSSSETVSAEPPPAV
ncbi:hypothetical protein F4860DRAFT_509661 [Xylaria cubensis]|nr:hypothetical protein F4860DRAFT_509661 [Xylaria cubensis]